MALEHQSEWFARSQGGIWLLFLVIRRVQDQPEEPPPPDIIPALGYPTVILGIGERATHDQPQRALDQLPLEMSKHIG